MKVVWNLLVVACLMAAAGFAGYLLGHRAPAPEAPEESDQSIQPVPAVRTAPIQQTRIERKITAYGVVTAQTSDVAILSLPFESRVRKVLVIPGERLDSAAPVIELEPSPDTQVQLLQARLAHQAADKDFSLTRQRFDAHLATNQDLLVSAQNLEMARLKLDSLEKQGAGSIVQLKSSGLVSKVDVQQGQIIPAGSPLVEMSLGGRVQVRLGIDPAEAAAVHLQDRVLVSQTNSQSSVEGKVQMVSQRINPDARLIDVFVSLPPDAAMPLDASVRGELTIAAADALVVPRSAVLPDDQGYSLFTVENQKATEHKVTLGVQNDDSVQINGDGLAAGQAVVILGNLELEDGMTVNVETASTEPAATQPTTQGAAQ
ncbi:MAG: HlyD family efflux transporter periplasmic adaptor subunit [Tepidisphaeraceae bacterium]